MKRAFYKLQVKQEEIAKKSNALIAEHDELEHLKINMDSYPGRGKKKKESVIGAIRRNHAEDKEKIKERSK